MHLQRIPRLTLLLAVIAVASFVGANLIPLNHGSANAKMTAATQYPTTAPSRPKPTATTKHLRAPGRLPATPTAPRSTPTRKPSPPPPPPTSSRPPRTSAAPSPPIWAGNYDTGTLSQFESTSWNNAPLTPTVTHAPAYQGSFAGKYVIPAGGNRCENVPQLRKFAEGDDYWFGWSTLLGSDFPLGVSNWQVINQWKNDGTGSPPLELKVSDGNFVLDGGYGWPGNTSAPQPRYWSQNLGRARPNVWDRWIVHIRFSSNAGIGTVDLWRNGTQIVSGLHPAGGTLYPGLQSYLKVGYYRDPAISAQGTVYHDDWKVGTTKASVS